MHKRHGHEINHMNQYLSKAIIREVCQQFMISFYVCVGQRKVSESRKAMLIRERVVEILKATCCPDIKDDGDIVALEERIKSI
jgi:hypothetical protein